MANKSKFLRNLLTTASAIAVIGGGVQTAGANLSVVTGDAVIVQDGGVGSVNTGDFAPPRPGLVGRVFQDNDALVYTGNFTLTTGDDVVIDGIDLNNNAVGRFTVAHNTDLGSVVNTGGAQLLPVTINGGVTLGLTGTAGLNELNVPTTANTYTGLGAITLNGANATLTLVTGGGVDLPGAITGIAANNGILNVTSGANMVTFAGEIGAGANSLASINIGGLAVGRATFNAAVNANDIIVGGANEGTVTFNGAVRSANGVAIGANGTASFRATSTIAGGVNLNNASSVVNIGNANAAMNITSNFTLADAAANLIVDKAGATINGTIAAIGAPNRGILDINAGGATINGVVGGGIGGRLANIRVGNGAVGSVTFVNAVTSKDITIGGLNAGTAIFNGAVDSTNAISVGGANNGTVTFKGAVTSANGVTVGQNSNVSFRADTGAGLGIVNLTHDTSRVNIGSGALIPVAMNAQAVFTLRHVAANIKVDQANTTITGTIDAAGGANLGILDIDARDAIIAGIVGGNFAIANIRVGNGAEGAVTFNNDVTSQVINVGGNNNGTAVFKGAVVAANGINVTANGNVEFRAAGNVAVGGDVRLETGTSKVKIGNVAGMNITTGFNLRHADATIIIDKNDTTITGAITGNANNEGTLHIDAANATITGIVGGARLANIRIGNTANGSVTFNAAVNSTNINIGVGGNTGTATFKDAVVSTAGIQIGGGTPGGNGIATFKNTVNGAITLGVAAGGTGTVTFDKTTNTGAAVTFAKNGSVVNIGELNPGVVVTATGAGFDFGGVEGTININTANSGIAGGIINGGNNGVLNINAANTTVGGVVGSGLNGQLARINVGNTANGAVTFANAVNSNKIDIGNAGFAGTAVFNGAVVAATKIQIGGNAVGGDSTALFNNTVTGPITLGVNAGSAGTATFNFAGDTTTGNAVTFANAGSIVNIGKAVGGNAGVVVTTTGFNFGGLAGRININTANSGIAGGIINGDNGSLNITAANTTVQDAITGLNAINVGNGAVGSVTFSNGAVNSANINIGMANNGTAIFNDAVTGAIRVGQDLAGVGNVTFNHSTNLGNAVTFDKNTSIVNIGAVNGNAGVVVQATDFNFANKAGVININTANSRIIGNISNSNDVGILNINAANTTVGGEVGAGNGALGVLNVGNTAAGSVTFTNPVTSQVINIGNGAANHGVAIFDNVVAAAANLNIGDVGGATGAITFNENTNTVGNITFFSDNSTINIAAGKSIQAAVFKFNNTNSTINVGDGGTIDALITSGGAGRAGKGTLEFAGAGRVTDAIAAEDNRVGQITTAAGVVTFDGAVNAAAMTTDAGAVTLTDAGNIAALNINGTGVVTTGDAVLTGNVVFGADGTLTLGKAAGNALAGNINFNGHAANVNVAAAGGVIHGDIDNVAGPAVGKVTFAQVGEIDGQIGASEAVAEIVAGNGVLALTKGGGNIVHKANTFTLSNNANSAFEIANAGGANKVTLIGNINATTGDVGKLTFLGNGEVQGLIGSTHRLNLVTIGGVAAGDLTLATGTHRATTFNFGNAGSSILLNNANTILIGNIEGGAGNQGIINVSNAATIQGTIGATAVIDKIQFTNAAGSLTVDAANVANGVIRANTGILFDEDGTLIIKGAKAQTITAPVLVRAGDAAGRGSISIDATTLGRDVIFVGEIGDTDVARPTVVLKSLAVNGSNITLADNSHIKKITFGGTGVNKLKLSGAKYKIQETEFTGADTATTQLHIDRAAVALRGAGGGVAVNYGTADKKLTDLSFVTALRAATELTIGENVNIYATNFTNNNIVGDGSLVFEGSSIFDAPITVANKLDTISTTGGAATDVKILNIVNAKNDIIVGAGTLSLGGAVVTATTIKAAVDNVGTLKFINGQTTTVTGAVGVIGNSFNTIEFNGKDVTFVGAVTHAAGKSFNFSGDTPKTIIFAADTDIGNNQITSSAKDGVKNTMVVSKGAPGDFTFTKSIGSANKPVEIKLGGANAINAILESTDLGNAFFTSAVDGRDTVTFKAGGGNLGGVGSLGAKVRRLNLNANGTIGNVFANDAIIDKGITTTFKGIISITNDLALGGAASKAILNEGAEVDTRIITNVANEGSLRFQGGAKLNKSIGSKGGALAEVDFVAADRDKNIYANSDINAVAIKLAGSTLNIGNNVIFTGVTSLNGTKVDLAANKVTLGNKEAAGGVTLVGDVELHTTLSAVGNTVAGGSILITPQSTVNLAGLTGMNIYLHDDNINTEQQGASFTLLDNQSDTFTAPTNAVVTNLNNDNRFTNWTVNNTNNGKIVLGYNDVTEKVLIEDLNKAGASELSRSNLDAVMQNPGIKKELQHMDSTHVNETLERLVPTTASSEVMDNNSSLMTSIIDIRIDSLQPTTTSTKYGSVDDMTGVAAGDDASKYGAWVNPFYNRAIQKARKGASGYSSATGGASFGIDTRVNEDMILGAALSILNTQIKHKDVKSSDKTKIDTLMVSIYGMQQITDQVFAQAIASFGSNRVTTNEKRITGNATSQNAAGKYSSMSFSGEAIVGYKYGNEQASITPQAGLRVTRINDGGYTETGTTNQNLVITKKAGTKLELLVGARIAGSAFNLNGLVLTPEIHGFINQDLTGKNPKVEARLENGNQSLNTRNNKPVRTQYNVGGGFNTANGPMEYGIGYDARIANKFVSHQGMLKLRVNF